MIAETILQLQSEKCAELLCRLYGKRNLENQTKRYIAALNAFKAQYGDGEVQLYSAPGRTEVGGNHTDHQNGKVLAAAVNLDAIAVVLPKPGTTIRLFSEGYGEVQADISDLAANTEEYGTTKALIRGVAAAMHKRGYAIGAFDAYVTSDVLSGSGLSSSAAFEVLLGNIFSGLYNQGAVDAITLAQIGQEAENIHFGKPCGLLDQMASSVGSLVYVDFGNPQKPDVQPVSLDLQTYGYALCVVDTKGSHADLTDEYAAIPGEMRSVAAALGKTVLSEVDKQTFYQNIPALREKLGDRPVLRAMHLYAENERADAQRLALEQKDFSGFLKLVKASGASSFQYLQNVYTSKNVQSQGISVALALSDELLQGQGVSRVQGGGFAGTIQAYVPEMLVESYRSGIEAVFGQGACHILSIRPLGGLRIL
ncbi:MAG: galactokinase [Oscillospiraceae bacterium]|nr:galactokinase [Oscillospiraceae bacterium]